MAATSLRFAGCGVYCVFDGHGGLAHISGSFMLSLLSPHGAIGAPSRTPRSSAFNEDDDDHNNNNSSDNHDRNSKGLKQQEQQQQPQPWNQA